MRKVYMSVRGHEKRIALMENDTLVECFFYRGEQETYEVGSIYIGRVTKVLKGMNAAFVDIGMDKMAYLHYSDTLQEGNDITTTIHQGQWIVVGIAKEAVDDKGPKLTQKIEIASDYGVYKPYEKVVTMSKQISDEARRKELKGIGRDICQNEDGVIFRSLCGQAPLEMVAENIHKLKSQYHDMKQQVGKVKQPTRLIAAASFVQRFFKEIPPTSIEELVVDDFHVYQEVKGTYEQVQYHRSNDDLFMQQGIEAVLEKATKKVVWLKNGSYLLIEQTETMTVIDVNTGKFVGKADQGDTVYKTNGLAAEEIARQLRLRDIGGMIVIDFINMRNPEQQADIRKAFIKETGRDRSQVRVFGFTSLGLLEVTRKRKRDSLFSYLSQPCHVCHSRGMVTSVETIVYELERELISYRHREEEAVLIQCSQDVVKGIEELITKDNLQQECGLFLFFEVQSSPLPFYNISRFGSVKEWI